MKKCIDSFSMRVYNVIAIRMIMILQLVFLFFIIAMSVFDKTVFNVGTYVISVIFVLSIVAQLIIRFSNRYVIFTIEGIVLKSKKEFRLFKWEELCKPYMTSFGDIILLRNGILVVWTKKHAELLENIIGCIPCKKKDLEIITEIYDLWYCKQ